MQIFALLPFLFVCGKCDWNALLLRIIAVDAESFHMLLMKHLTSVSVLLSVLQFLWNQKVFLHHTMIKCKLYILNINIYILSLYSVWNNRRNVFFLVVKSSFLQLFLQQICENKASKKHCGAIQKIIKLASEIDNMQWQIHDFPKVGAPTPKVDVKSYYLVDFPPPKKTAWNWKNMDFGGASLAPP